MKVGWIGLGKMGEAFALKILSGGHDLVAHSRGGRPREALQAAGGQVTPSLIEAVTDVDVVGVGLFDDAQLEDVMTAELYAAMRPGTVVAVHTTGTPEAIERVAAAAPSHVTVLDAPFSGIEANAEKGDVKLFVGGDGAALERARPVLGSFCDPIVHLGEVGAGRRFKVINNLLFAAHITLAAEGLKALSKMGVKAEVAIDGLAMSSGGSFATSVFRTGEADEVVERMAKYMVKDVGAAKDAARVEGLDLPLLTHAVERYLV